LYFLIAYIAVFSVVSANSEVVQLNSPSQLCPSHPISEDVFTSLRADNFCLQSFVVPEGQAAQLYVTNRETYCGQLNEDKRELAKITGGASTRVNFCTATARSFSLPSGSYYIAVSRTRIPLKVSLTYHNT
ncbi:hypothetical protein PMAYCL1PPCAC_31281, partial [Pristionchus mayeri]